MLKVTLTSMVRLQVGSTPENIRSYEGGPGEVLTVPGDVARLIVAQGSGVAEPQEAPVAPVEPVEAPKPPSRKRRRWLP